jgi:multiple sugar transport system substrate-binding protein
MRRTLVLFLVSALLAAGCTRTLPQSTQQAPPTAAAPVTIKLGIVTGLPGKPELDAVVAAFQDRYPDYRVETVTLPQDDNAVYQAMLHGDVDLIQAGSAHLHLSVQSGATADLTPYLQTAGMSTSALEWYLSAARFRGKVLELPYAVVPAAVLYNRELAVAAGVTVPEAGWTWDQFRDIAQRLTKQAGESHTWGLVNDAPWIPATLWINQAGGLAQNRPSSDALADALQFFSDLIFADRSMVPPRRWDGQGPPPEDLFANGKAALTIKPLPDPRSGQTLPLEWGAAPLPNLPGARPVLFVYPRSLAMSANAPNAEAAWQFLKFLTGKDGAMVVAAAGSLPCYPSADAKDLWLQSRPGLPQSVRSLLDTQWLTIYWYLTGETRDGLVYEALRVGLETNSSWQPAVADYVQRAKQAGVK